MRQKAINYLSIGKYSKGERAKERERERDGEKVKEKWRKVARERVRMIKGNRNESTLRNMYVILENL